MQINFMLINCSWIGYGEQVKWMVSPNPQPSKSEFQENDNSDLEYNIKFRD